MYAAICYGQATSTISGTVTDKSGAVVPDAAITITNQGTNQVRKVVADETGKYTVTFLPVGIYSVSAEKTGFATSVRKDIELQANSTVQSDLQLEIRGTSEQVHVSAEPALVQSTSTTLVQVVDARRIARSSR